MDERSEADLLALQQHQPPLARESSVPPRPPKKRRSRRSLHEKIPNLLLHLLLDIDRFSTPSGSPKNQI
jgi:hypothetical protein